MTTSELAAGSASPLSIGQRTALTIIHWYQMALSPNLGTHCRFAPSCSQYAAEAIELHKLPHGVALTVRRLLRCRPGGGSGFDAVPPRSSGKTS